MNRVTLRWLVLAAVALALGACATPIGVTRGSTEEVHRALTGNVLSTGQPSEWSKQVLHRNSLSEKFDDDPVAALAELHKLLQERTTTDRLFALAELSFLHAQRANQREYYLAAAVYAYAFLLPEREDASPIRPIDPRARLSVDLYNLGTARAFASGEGDEVKLEAGTRPLPFGEVTLTLDESQFRWAGYRFSRFIPVGEFIVRGLSNRYRQPGIGMPLAAEVEPIESGPAAEAARKRIPPRIKVPVTAFIRLADPLRGVLDGKLQGRIELYAADQTLTVNVGGRDVPLELEATAALAYQLDGAPVWDFELAGFRFAEEKILADGLLMLHPYRPGRIPVVLVHGTASSPARWAEMVNELGNDPVLGDKYQFWLYQYSTGQPILYSAMLLRRALHAVVAEVDPDGKDPALRRMIIIGHSQGGLLTKLMAVHSENRFWNNMSDEPFEQFSAPPETRELVKDAAFFDPVPGVERVIFIATPHRGSFRATGWVLGLVRRFVTLPGRLVSQFQGLLASPELSRLKASQLPTSVDNMSPGNPFLQALGNSPIDPKITAHSIIAVRRPGALIGQTDGVVAYESAHIDGVASELIVRSDHSTQGTPETIGEVRRILREHIGAK